LIHPPRSSGGYKRNAREHNDAQRLASPPEHLSEAAMLSFAQGSHICYIVPDTFMFLFSKKGQRIMKYLGATVGIIVALSMIFTYFAFI
jgi:hypothetical protein